MAKMASFSHGVFEPNKNEYCPTFIISPTNVTSMDNPECFSGYRKSFFKIYLTWKKPGLEIRLLQLPTHRRGIGCQI